MDEQNESDREERIELTDKQKEVLNCFKPSVLFETFKENWAMVFVWAAFFFAGFALASYYYQVAANSMAHQYIMENCKIITEQIPNISWVNGTIFG